MSNTAQIDKSFDHNNSIIKIHITEGKDIDLEIPVPFYSIEGLEKTLKVSKSTATQENLASNYEIIDEKPQKKLSPKIIRSFKRKYFKIDKIEFADQSSIDGTTLYLKNLKNLCEEACNIEDLVTDIKLKIMTSNEYKTYYKAIMDIQPIELKEDGDIGVGITRIIDGIVIVLTVTDENGVQIGEFGLSETETDKGGLDEGEIIIEIQVIIKAGTDMRRYGPLAAYKASGYITGEIRKALKDADLSLVTREEEFYHTRRPGAKKVVIVKEIIGETIPLMLSPTEVLDGGIIGSISKECSNYYFRDPLVMLAMDDEEIDLAGIILVGSPEINSEGFSISKRLGMMVEAMDIDGAIVISETYENDSIYFASHIEQIGQRGAKVVGVAIHSSLDVKNKYMNNFIDLDKSLCKEDAVRALYMLKEAMTDI